MNFKRIIKLLWNKELIQRKCKPHWWTWRKNCENSDKIDYGKWLAIENMLIKVKSMKRKWPLKKQWKQVLPETLKAEVVVLINYYLHYNKI